MSYSICVGRIVSVFTALLFTASLVAQQPDAPKSAGHGDVGAAKPVFQKVDPPSWWTHSTLSPVRLLIRGENLTPGTVLRSESPELVAYNYRTSENGHYLFCDLQIGDKVAPGTYKLSLRQGNVEGDTFAFTIDPPLSHERQPHGYSQEDVIYFVMPDRFADGDPNNNKSRKSPDLFNRKMKRSYHGGDLQGLIDKLPYIQSLGATAIWTTPIYDNNDGLDHKEVYNNDEGKPEPSTGYHGYGAIDMYAVDEHFGDVAKLKEFVQKAHAQGLKVIQDQVANHTGPYHIWATDPPTPTWWNGTNAKHASNNWQKWTAMNPRATRQTQSLNIDGWFIDVLPDFNQDDPEVSRYLIQNSIWWLHAAEFDAIRMDTLPHVPRTFWGEWGKAIKREFPKTVILGELFDSDPALISYFQTGRTGHDGVDTQIDTLFDFSLFGPIRSVFAKGKHIRELQQTFAHDWLYPNADVMTTFLGVHDMQRFMSEDGATIEGLNLAFTLIMTSRGTPIIYYGDEIAMRGGPDPDNRRDFMGGFPGDARNAFLESGRTEEENKVWKHVARLGALRKQCDALRWGKSLDLVDREQQYVYARVTEEQSVIVVFNNENRPAEIRFDVSMLPGDIFTGTSTIRFEDALGSGTQLNIEGGNASISLSTRTAAIFVIDQVEK